MLEWSHLPVVGAIYPGKKIDWDRIKTIVLNNPDISAYELERAAAVYQHQFSTEGQAVEPPTLGGDRPFEVSYVTTGLMLISREILLKLVAEGQSSREIAETLVISIKTVEKHRAAILAKLGMRDRTQLTRYAIRAVLIEP